MRGRLQCLRRGWIACLTTFTIACASPTMSNDNAERVRRESMSLDCRMSATDCSSVSDAIGYLQSSSSPTCQQRGSEARARFEAFGYGFRYGTGPADPATAPYDMYVVPTNDPFGPPTNRNTYINASGSALLMEIMGGLIAHEEVHHSGFNLDSDPTTGLAYQTGYACMG